MKKEIKIDESIIDRFNLLKLNNPEKFKDIELFVNKAVEQYSKDLIKKNKIKSLSNLSVAVGTEKLFNLQKNLSNLTKIQVSKKPFISNKLHRFTTINNFEKEFLILKSRDFVTVRALQVLYNNTIDNPIEFEDFKKLAVEDAIALREETEVVDYFSMLLKPIGDR